MCNFRHKNWSKVVKLILASCCSLGHHSCETRVQFSWPQGVYHACWLQEWCHIFSIPRKPHSGRNWVADFCLSMWGIWVSQLFSFSVMILSYTCYEYVRCGHLVMSNALIVLLCGGCRLFRTICQHGSVGIVRLIASNVSFVVNLGGLIHLLDLRERSASQSHWSLLTINWNLEVHDRMCKSHLAHYFASMCSWFSF